MLATTSVDFDERLKTYRSRLEQGILHWLPSANESPSTLHEAMLYSLEAGGKRLRPVLVMAAADLWNESADPVPAALAVECLHTYSLIHDDLPAMDDSDLRRGKPSCHFKYGESMGVLAGDALLTEAFALLGRGYVEVPAISSRLVVELGEAAGSRHLIAGQVMDIAAEEIAPESWQAMTEIHRRKTGALIRSSLAMGAIVAGASEEKIAILKEAGAALGLAFQIVDDLLDATGDEAQLGKTVGQDATNNKTTALTFMSVEEARTEVDRLSDACIAGLKQMEGDTAFLEALVDKMKSRVS